MKKVLLPLAVALLVTWSCENPEAPEVNQQEKVKVTIPDILQNTRRSGRGRVEVELAETLNSTLFANSSIKITEICIHRKLDPIASVEVLDKQFERTLTSRWVPGDERRDWNGDGDLNDIDWLSFTPLATANGVIDATPIYRAMYKKWEKGGFCKNVDIDETAYDLSMGNPSLILGIGGLPPAANPLSDVSVIGFIPAFIFELVFGEPNVLGVAFSFVFIDENGDPTVTNFGKEDKAFTEVWFNDGFPWSIGPTPTSIDLESVILHEFGHTMNLGHFGALIEFTFASGTTKLIYKPVNTMNAIYIGEPRNFLGLNDRSNYCLSWGTWPWK